MKDARSSSFGRKFPDLVVLNFMIVKFALVEAPSDEGDPIQATPFSGNPADAFLRKKRDRPLSGRHLLEDESPVKPAVRETNSFA